MLALSSLSLSLFKPFLDQKGLSMKLLKLVSLWRVGNIANINSVKVVVDPP